MFLEKDEISLNKEFIEKGYIVRPVANLTELDKIQKIFVEEIDKKFKPEKSNLLSLNNFHKKININDLNI